MDVFFYILEGEGMVEIGKEVANVPKDMIVECMAKVPWALMNPGEKDFRSLVVKTPGPKEGAKAL